MSNSPALHSKWLLLPKIEISLVVNFCFITNQNELSFSIKHEHAYVIVVENGGCNTSHSKRVEQAFYSKYTGK
jgi:hypothetical protein